MSDALPVVEGESKSRACGLCWIRTGAIFAGLAVVTGAWAAHGLEKILLPKYEGETRVVVGQEIPRAVKHVNDFFTGSEYQMYHSLALIAVGLLLLSGWGSPRLLNVAGWSFVVGILLFPGSLYVLVLTGKTWLGMVAPIGGTAFIVGWVALAISCVQTTRSPDVGRV